MQKGSNNESKLIEAKTESKSLTGRKVGLGVLMFLLLLFFALSFAGVEEGLFKVAKVIDGDTIELENGERVRYIGIDTPETKHPQKPVELYGEEATEFNRQLVEGKIVRIETDVQVRDKYRRILAYVWVDTIFINAELVKQGYAQVSTYPPNVRYEKLFLKLQTEAREAGRGLWSDSLTETEKDETYFVGSKKSNKFHHPDCRYAKKIKPENLIVFPSIDKAREAGYIPCKVCKPAPLNISPTVPVKDDSDIIVYITRTGSKYHRGTCSYLRKSKIPISLKEAKAKGYGPCSRCRPPR